MTTIPQAIQEPLPLFNGHHTPGPIGRWYALVRYHRPAQFVRRAIGLGRRRWERWTRGGRLARPLATSPERRAGAPLRAMAERKLAMRRGQSSAEAAKRILEGRFRFLNLELALPDPVDWRLSGSGDVDPLWRFHLHYHEYLLDLLAANPDDRSCAPRERAWELVRQWIAANPLDNPLCLDDAWHPFCISRRIPVWTVLWQLAPPEKDLEQIVAENLYRQVLFLERHLERDLGGNHLLENARALAVGGRFFSGSDAERWRGTSRDILQTELQKQILPHGEHFERCPMYHVLMLEALLDVRDSLTGLDDELSDLCGRSARRMADFLWQILHPDGEIPLLGDSALNEAPRTDELIAHATGTPALETAGTGGMGRRSGDYWSWRDRNDFLLFDAGPVGPDHLPAHAHSDLSTIEASIQGQRFIVDSGVFAYSDDGLRRYCRSTAAHNVLQLDDQEQCDTWSRFRMGYRGHPTGFETGCDQDFHWARMSHDAYRRTGVPCAGRWIACRRGSPWFIVDWAIGQGTHRLSNWLHLHPDVRIEKLDADRVLLQAGSAEVRVGTLAPGKLEIVEGVYCSEFGRRLAAPVLRWTVEARLPTVCGWWIARGGLAGSVSVSSLSSPGPLLTWHAADGKLDWKAETIVGDYVIRPRR